MLVVRGCTLAGAREGLKFYLLPRPRALARPRPWLDAANQIVYSLGIGTGQMVAFGSYNPADEDVVADACGIALLNSFTSLFAGVAVFAMLGHKARNDGVDVADVVDSGEGLAFVAYPDGLASLPGASKGSNLLGGGQLLLLLPRRPSFRPLPRSTPPDASGPSAGVTSTGAGPLRRSCASCQLRTGSAPGAALRSRPGHSYGSAARRRGERVHSLRPIRRAACGVSDQQSYST